jgi:hypothetical protein
MKKTPLWPISRNKFILFGWGLVDIKKDALNQKLVWNILYSNWQSIMIIYFVINESVDLNHASILSRRWYTHIYRSLVPKDMDFNKSYFRVSSPRIIL